MDFTAVINQMEKKTSKRRSVLNARSMEDEGLRYLAVTLTNFSGLDTQQHTQTSAA